MNKSIRKLLAVATVGMMLLPAVAFAGKGPVSPSTPAETVKAGKGGESLTKKASRLEVKGTLVSVGADSLVLKNKKGLEATVMVTADTRLKFRGGKLMLSEFAAGDEVKVVAKKNDAGQWVARQVLNQSLKKTTVHGTVKNLSGSAFEVETKERGTFMVTVSDKTKFHSEDDKPATLANVANGSTVTVKGILRKGTKTFTSVARVGLTTPELEETVTPPAETTTPTETTTPSGDTTTPPATTTDTTTTTPPATTEGTPGTTTQQ